MLRELFLSIHHDPSPTEGHDCSCGGGGGDAPWQRHVFADMIWLNWLRESAGISCISWEKDE